ncbi:hypothetical protein PV327_009291 [Microctonus hyperodae]|uniref:FAS1 domain-containing protein n=1 Tax=Microctonus hyperodae TaxID=165561 RepID=A0AA39FTR1_MICHY|nr:hypothetical protein PV327_009291 [Microctonus hyperodae]
MKPCDLRGRFALYASETFAIFQSHPTLDHRPRLSSVQQQQILNDVQQHQPRFNFDDSPILGFSSGQSNIGAKPNGFTNTFSSLAKYRVDRTKQTPQRSEPSFFQTSQTQYQFPNRQNFITASSVNPFNTFQTDLPIGSFQSPKQDLNFYNDPTSSLQLQTFYEKQRELALLRKQREQLIAEQQELKRQQEQLQIQRLRALTSTTAKPTPQSTTVKATTPQPITTQSSILLPSPTARRITPAESEIFLKAIATHQKKFTTTTVKSIVAKTSTTENPSQDQGQDDNQDIPKDLLSLIQAQNPQLLGNGKIKPQVKIIYQTEKPPTPQKSFSSKSKSLEKDQLLRQLKIALTENAGDEKNITTRDLVLPNGRKLQVIQAPNGLSSIVPNEGSSQFQTVTQALDSSSTPSTTTVKPANTILDELTKGVLPPGTDFEVLRHKADGKLEDVGKSSIQNSGKKVTFVVLEEQPDGSYKVQGVKGNAEKESGSDVESIVERIKKGEIKLPPPSTKNIQTEAATTTTTTTTTTSTTTEKPTTMKPTTIRYPGISSTTKTWDSESSGDYSPFVTVTPNSISPSSDNYVTSASTPAASIYNSFSTFNPTSSRPTSSSSIRIGGSSISPLKNHFIPTMAPVNEIISSTTAPPFITTFSPHSSSYTHFSSTTANSIPISTTPRVYTSTISSINNAASENLILVDDVHGRNTGNNIENNINQFTNINNGDTMVNLLKREGLFAMAKYLRQSGLDTLLLHHVIPGAFRVDALQEEMTGVSLAGTQLRVNVYDMHDHEWNDVKVTTINGAKILPNKRDLEIPQGIVHAIDRVMFPLPVGDLMQTLAADREQRFGTFLKMLHAAGMDEELAGTKTFTVFAPTDGAFLASATQNGRPVWTENDGAEMAKVIVSRHIMPTTLYTAGMRYYHQKDTLRPQFLLKIQKNGGRIRVNEAQVSTNNVPATNGVIHAVDSVL